MGYLEKTNETFALSVASKRDVCASVPWFVEKSKYPPRPANFIEPLINGERAFKAVYEAISKAKKTVDIISWGFDPSMRLIRPNGERLGELLRRKADAHSRKDGTFSAPETQVRILIWKNTLTNFGENNLPGDGLGGSGGTVMGSGVGSTSAGGGSGSDANAEFNDYAGKVGNSAAVLRDDDEARAFNRAWFSYQPPKLEFRTRDFNRVDRGNILAHQVVQRGLTNVARSLVMAEFASHHQKMILIDYESPDDAIGFVMGHNLLRNYWDTDAHDYFSILRHGFAPWQDLSCKVRGPVLFDLHENFKTAWEKAQIGRGQKITWSAERDARKSEDFIAPAQRCGKTELAQICRTQPQENDRSILASYKLALGNARNYVYFENQYFRYVDLALLLRELRRKLKAAGWKRDFYIFVVTNTPPPEGKENTFEMLDALGKGQQMPSVQKKSSGKRDKDAELRKSDLEGVNIHICSLMACAARPEGTKYKEIYVHSKLLLVDDTFFTLGSANINARSMEGDSELNISVPSPTLTRQWREHLWKMHSGMTPGANMATEFEKWGDVMEKNAENKDKSAPLVAPLVEFFDPGEPGRVSAD